MPLGTDPIGTNKKQEKIRKGKQEKMRKRKNRVALERERERELHY